ncbi:MAG: UDP-N-acetylmuramoyl-L-alanine--D-glutamate ligase [Clostridia bacterium]|nr:UDP-N-acetylmuramoyl-L-alanine--D-glutamate ligase [Clostridia bacterium]
MNEKLKEFNTYLKNRKVAVIGLGVSNLPLLDYLHEKGSIVTVFDDRNTEKISKEAIEKVNKYEFETSFGENNLDKLVGFDLIFRSPSCMPTKKELVEEEKRGAIVTSEIEMLMEMAPCKVIGVTGSDGKTTTTSLIYEIVKNAGYNTHLGGNIGIPLFTKLKDIESEDVIVLELSSFQLMNMNISADISVITNITPNHLNIHASYEEYIDAKKNIFKNQKEDGIVVLNYDNELTRNCRLEANGKVIYFSSKEKLENGIIVDNDVIKECEDRLRKHIINTKDIHLRGMHNYENVAAAIAATKSFIDIDTIVDAIKKFKGVEHRIEFIRELDGVKWYNDSIGTSPTRTIAGLNSFSEDIILIAGGYDKHLDYEPIAKPIVDNVKGLILIGQTSEKIYEAVTKELEKENKELDIYQCNEFPQIVEVARKIAKTGQVVLFSPASASFDLFENFAQRGNKFKELVNDLK